MVNNFLGNPHKTEYEDIDEDFNVLAEEFLDDQDSSDYEDEDDDYYEEEEEDDNYDEEDDDDDDDTENFWDLGFLGDSEIDSDIPGPPGNPHKNDYEDIDEDFNVLAEEFIDDQDSSDYEDEDDDYYEKEKEDDNYDEEDDDDDDGTENFWDLDFLGDSDIDSDIPGAPDSGREDVSDDDMQKQENTISNDKESAGSKVPEDRAVHKNIGNNSET